MKRIFKLFLIFIVSLALGLHVLFHSITLPLLPPEEQAKIKSAHSFWEWNSPFGKLAIHYEEKGAGPNHVIMLHGFRANTFTWRHLIEPLAQNGFHVWTIDFVGFGLSDKPLDVPYDVSFFLQQITAFLEDKNIQTAHLIGSSMGGGIVLNYALDNAEKVASMTLLSPLGYPVKLPLYLSLSHYLSSLWTPFLGPFLVKTGSEQIVYDPTFITQEFVDAYCLPYRLPGGKHATLLTLEKFDNQILEELSARYPLPHPIMIIWGENDPIIPVDHYYSFLKDFTHARGLLIAKCGHLPHEEKPSETVPAILQFLNDHKIPE